MAVVRFESEGRDITCNPDPSRDQQGHLESAIIRVNLVWKPKKDRSVEGSESGTAAS